MTRNELAKAVQGKGIQTPKNPFFMSSIELEQLINASLPKVKVTVRKVASIKALASKGLTRKEVLAEMAKIGMTTTNGYLNNISREHGIKFAPAK